ncbi:MobF family relaxase [Vibrio cholerae]|uniref:MobF family relaxase n=1 Tax=Vibrio cholerae TaxID=666 RepID=UPI000893B2A0|nr:MobF family relaxase [Vibrio cholerae]OFJ35986.1 hypothetical protein BFX34_01020 [Vibrio cholerae]
MLTIFPIRNHDYYAEWTQNDYYLNNAELPGDWAGYIARLLGLNGEVGEKEYHNLMNGFSPDGKTAYVQNTGEKRNMGYDLTFSAPKSVSILEVFDDRLIIYRAHRKAVEAALRFIEERAAYTRRKAQGQELEKLPGLLAALFTHFKSRSDDMQLHTHCLVLNLAIRNDLTWGTINGRTLYQWMKASGAVYRAELAQNLRELGYSIEEDGESFKVAGVPNHICQYFSKRDEQISEALKNFNEKSSASPIGDHIKLYTRDKKKSSLCTEDYQRWQAELTALGFDREYADSIRYNYQTSAKKYCDTNLALDELTKTKSVFREQDLYHHIAKQAQFSGDRTASISSLSFSATISDRVITLGEDRKGYGLYSTKEIVNLERNLITLAKKTSSTHHQAPDELLINEIIRNQSGCSISEEQIAAILSACNDKRLSILQGSAGSGKSFSMNILRQAYETQGQRVLGACIAKAAADNLQNETSIKSGTIAKLLSDNEAGRSPLKNTDVLVIDEAGQVGVKQMHALLSLAEKHDTKIVLVGEDKQLDAIEHGGVLSYLSRPHIIGASRIENIRRQQEKWARKAVMDFRDGNAYKAMKELDKRNLINISVSKDEAISLLINNWKKHVNQNKEALVLAQKWIDVTAISKQLRQHYQSIGKVGPDKIELDCTVSGKYMKLPFSVGERVRFTKNDYQLNISNGSYGIVEAIDEYQNKYTFHVRLDGDRLITFDTHYYQDEHGKLPLVHGYAMTIYSSQGITVNGDTFILYSSGMGREATYVAGSRHKFKSHFFLNSMDIEASVPDKNMSRDDVLIAFSNLMNQQKKSTLAIDYIKSEAKEYLGREESLLLEID